MTTESAEQFAAPGSVLEIRDETWLVQRSERASDGWFVEVQGLSELVRGTEATFSTAIDDDHPARPGEGDGQGRREPALQGVPAVAGGDAAQDRRPAGGAVADGGDPGARRRAALPAHGGAPGAGPEQPSPADPARRRGRAGEDARDRDDPGRAGAPRPRRADPGRDAAARAGADAVRAVDAVRAAVRPARLARASSGSARSCRPPATRSRTSSGRSSRSTR